MKKSILIYVLVASLGMMSCKKKGCTNGAALNYNSEAEKDDGSCEYAPVTKSYSIANFSGLDVLNVSGITSTDKMVSFTLTDSINSALYLNHTEDIQSADLPKTGITSQAVSTITDLTRTLKYEVKVEGVSKGIFYFKPSVGTTQTKSFHFENNVESLVTDVRLTYSF